LLVHICDPPPKSNQAASLESQMIPTIQYVLGRALKQRDRHLAVRATELALWSRSSIAMHIAES
jgi:hypothetical protein